MISYLFPTVLVFDVYEWMVLHEKWKQKAEIIAEGMELSEAQVVVTLEYLQNQNMVFRDGRKWVINKEHEIFIPFRSFMCEVSKYTSIKFAKEQMDEEDDWVFCGGSD